MSKKPKKIETEKPTTKKSNQEEMDNITTFKQLRKDRMEYYQDFEDNLQRTRKEFIKYIQEKRGSKIITFYSKEPLTIENTEIFFEILQKTGKVEILDLFLLSPGGFTDSAFKMAKWCRQYSDKFNIIIPYYAKSAATLLSLGADSLIMSPSSELGPIDPQISIPDGYGRTIPVSALSIKDALKIIEKITEGNPEKAYKYLPLIEKIDLNVLGEYDRAIQSSKQYASKLLETGNLLSEEKKLEHKKIAQQLTEEYYSHGYSIDRQEARELGLNIIFSEDTDIWNSVWMLHKIYEEIIDHSNKETRISNNLIEYRKITTILETETWYIPMEQKIIK